MKEPNIQGAEAHLAQCQRKFCDAINQISFILQLLPDRIESAELVSNLSNELCATVAQGAAEYQAYVALSMKCDGEA